MTEQSVTPEEEETRAAIEQRRAGFIACMSRVAAPGEGGEEDTCECCGYPFLYYDRDALESCVVCGWDPACADDLAKTRVASSISFIAHSIGEPHELARRKLVAALDALLADNNPANDKAHWVGIRAAFDALAHAIWPDPGRRLRFNWGFAGKLDDA